MRILLDTNIIIPLEDSSKTPGESFSELVRLANANNLQLIVYPASLEDIQRDGDGQRRKISLSRVRKYPFLENPPIPDASELERLELKQEDENDRVDNQILYSIYKDAANILMTEDRGLHRKAAILLVAFMASVKVRSAKSFATT
jgi:predicted nucleic acid-binding protein